MEFSITCHPIYQFLHPSIYPSIYLSILLPFFYLYIFIYGSIDNLRVEVEAEGGEVGAEGEGDQVGIRLCRPDKRQQPDHAKLVHHHRRGNVRYQT